MQIIILTSNPSDLMWAGHTLMYWIRNYIIGFGGGIDGLVKTIINTLLNNPFFCFLFAVMFVKIGFTLIRKSKKASR